MRKFYFLTLVAGLVLGSLTTTHAQLFKRKVKDHNFLSTKKFDCPGGGCNQEEEKKKTPCDQTPDCGQTKNTTNNNTPNNTTPNNTTNNDHKSTPPKREPRNNAKSRPPKNNPSRVIIAQPPVERAKPRATDNECQDCGKQRQNDDLVNIGDVTKPVEADCVKKIIEADLEKIKNIVRELGCKTDHPCAVKAILDEIAKEMKLPPKLLYAVAWTENKNWTHYNEDGVAIEGKVNEFGLMQISSYHHYHQANDGTPDEMDGLAKENRWMQILEDVLYNSREGGGILQWSYNYAKTYQMKNGKSWSADDLARAAYGVYNGGPRAVTRFENPQSKYAANDVNFNNNYKNEPWKEVLKDCPNKEDPKVVITPVKNVPKIIVAEDPKEPKIKTQTGSDSVDIVAVPQKPLMDKKAAECVEKIQTADLSKYTNLVLQMGCKTDEPCFLVPIFKYAAQKFGIPLDLLMTVGYIESQWSSNDNHGQWRKSGETLVVGGDHGIMQINEQHKTARSWVDPSKQLNWSYIDGDAFYNIMYGAKYLADKYQRAVEYSKNNAMGWNWKQIYQSAYSMYNGGPGKNNSNANRFLRNGCWSKKSQKYVRCVQDTNFEKDYDKMSAGGLWKHDIRNCSGGDKL